VNNPENFLTILNLELAIIFFVVLLPAAIVLYGGWREIRQQKLLRIGDRKP